MTNSSLKSRIIYLVDRDELSRTSLGNEFRKLNCRVETAVCVDDAVERIRESDESAILLIEFDIATAGNVLTLIKSIPGSENIPVLFMVRQADTRMIHSMDSIRPSGYVLKDIGFPVIADSVKNAITVYDRSDAKESENRALKRKDARMEYILNRIEDGIIEIDDAGVVSRMNLPAEKILECKADRIVGKQVESVFVFDKEDTAPGFSHYRDRVIQTGTDQYFPDDTIILLPNGEKKSIRGFVSPLDVEDDSGLDTMIIFRDVKIIRTLRSVLKQTFSEMHKLVNELHKSMYMDSLTDLPNRISLYEQINRKLADNDSKSRFALVFVDIDNFRNITKTFGHIASDGIISDIGRKTAAYRLQKGPDKCFVARLSSDEFVIMFKKYENNDTLLRKVIELNDALSSGYEIDGVSFDITVSMGISRYPEDGVTVSDLMRKADIALSKAKEKGKQSIKMFNGEFDKKLRWNLSVEQYLRHSIEQNELSMRYQPQCGMETKNIDGYECLLRWNSPALGMVPPNEFIAIAEKTGLIVHIGEWVLRQAFSFVNEIYERHGDWVNVSVNVSVVQIMQKGFAERVIALLDEAGIPADSITLEITESVFIRSFNDVIQCITKLKERGFRLSIDDFEPVTHHFRISNACRSMN